jgi:hypothetical protein
MPRMKFHENMIIKGEMMNGNKIFICLRNIENIVKRKITRWCMNNGMTNLINFHTWPTFCVNLIIAKILVPSCKLLKISSDMIRNSQVNIPTSVHIIRISGVRVLLFSCKVTVEAFEALQHCMPLLSTQLALGAILREFLTIVLAPASAMASTTAATDATTLHRATTSSRCRICSRVLLPSEFLSLLVIH